jgi:hypothetical protein
MLRERFAREFASLRDDMRGIDRELGGIDGAAGAVSAPV